MTIEDTAGFAAKVSTCNCTSLAMSLELLGKTTADYVSDKKDCLLAAVRHFHDDLTVADGERTAKKYSSNLSDIGADDGKTWAALMGLRLPDFLELAAVAEYMTAPTEAEAERARGVARGKKIDQDFLDKLARRFKVSMTPKHINWNSGQSEKLTGVDDTLRGFGGQRGSVEKFEHFREAVAKDEQTVEGDTARNDTSKTGQARAKRDQAQLAKDQASLDKYTKKVSLHGGNIDSKIPVDRYRDEVISQLQPVIDSGAAIMVGATAHWIRLYSLSQDGIIVQDPGSYYRHEQKVPWEEARAMGYFWTNLVFR